jgi:hypothetical protein
VISSSGLSSSSVVIGSAQIGSSLKAITPTWSPATSALAAVTTPSRARSIFDAPLVDSP